MKNKGSRKKVMIVVIGIIGLLLGTTMIPAINGQIVKNNIDNQDEQTYGAMGTPEYYAVVAACSSYKNPANNLPISEFDLKSLYRTLAEAALKPFSNWKLNNIILLINEDATRANMLNAFDEIAGKVNSGDVFLFSWQGHGSEVGGLLDRKQVICPYDCDYITDPNNPLKQILTNYIDEDELDSYFHKIADPHPYIPGNQGADEQFLIFESCLSGGLVEGSFSCDIDNNGIITDNEAQIYTENFKYALAKTSFDGGVSDDGRVVVVSTLGRPDTIGRGSWIFGFPMTLGISFALKQSILGEAKDDNNDGWISAQEAFGWARPRIFAMNSVFWMGIWTYFFAIEYEYQQAWNVSDAWKVAIEATKLTMVEFCYVQVEIFLMSGGHFLLNWPHMVDRTNDGDLPLMKIHWTSKSETTKLPYLPKEIWTPEPETGISLRDLDEQYWPKLEVETSHTLEGKTITCNAQGYNGPTPFTYNWNFGDGTTSTEQNPTHTYSSKGTYTVKLTVTDDANRQKETSYRAILIKNKAYHHGLLLKLLESFPKLWELLSLFK